MFTWNMFNLQDSCSPYTDYLYIFHDLVMMMITMIISMIIYLMFNILYNKFINRFLLQGHLIEIIWTIIPMIILLILALPSIKILYFMDEVWTPLFITIKAIGKQWYWSYEYPEFNNMEFDSFMINHSNPDDNNIFRLLDVDNRLIAPIITPIRILTTSLDVIHSWAVPSLGMKLDASPGRVNQVVMIILHTGMHFGQCSEICGANHSFMPIVIESTLNKYFNEWTLKNMN